MAFRNFFPPCDVPIVEVSELREVQTVTRKGVEVDCELSNDIHDLPDYRSFNADVLESAGVSLQRVSPSVLSPDSQDVIDFVESDVVNDNKND